MGTSVSGHSMYAVVDPSTGDIVKEYPTATNDERAALIRRIMGHCAP